jgi:hypothetical protein
MTLEIARDPIYRNRRFQSEAIFVGKTRGKSACAGTKVGTVKQYRYLCTPLAYNRSMEFVEIAHL